MSSTGLTKKLQLDELALNIELSFTRGVDRVSRVLRLSEDIEEYHFDWFDAAMSLLENDNPRKTITIKLCTYGGDLYAALGIIARLRESSCRIHTKGYGKIMSAGTLILASGDKRGMSKLCTIMHHEPSYDVGGKHSEVTNYVKQAQTESELWATLMQEFTGVNKEHWETKGHKGLDYYMNADSALSLCVVDELF